MVIAKLWRFVFCEMPQELVTSSGLEAVKRFLDRFKKRPRQKKQKAHTMFSPIESRVVIFFSESPKWVIIPIPRLSGLNTIPSTLVPPQQDMGVEPKIGLLYSQIIHFNRIFHYKPSIFRFSPYFWVDTRLLNPTLPTPGFTWLSLYYPMVGCHLGRHG